MRATQPRSDALGSRLEILDLVLTSHCNLSCDYCYQTRSTVTAARMSWPTARAALDLLLSSRSNQLTVALTGGEPLLERTLVARILVHLHAHRRPGQMMMIAVTTNGTLLDDDLAELLVEHDVWITISFDGLAEIQRRRGPATYGRVKDALCRLRGHDSRYFSRRAGVAVTVLPDTVDALPDAVRRVLDLGVRHIELGPDCRDTSGWQISRRRELETAFDALTEIMASEFERSGEVPVALLAAAPQTTGNGRPSTCGVTSGTNLTIDADGQAYGCVAFIPAALGGVHPAAHEQLHRLRLGSIHEAGFPSRWATFPAAASRTPVLRPQESQHSFLGTCSDCAAAATCRVCPLAVVRHPSFDPLRIPAFHCAFNLAAHRARERLAARLALGRPVSGLPVPEDLRQLVDIRGHRD